jgi:DNA-binding transcriptional MerR regulator/methylmalonyl-CoA mutase cobalamin-binding subunit
MDLDTKDNIATRPRHPIRVVAQRTGLTPDVLRAWEKRYAVVVPERSDSGQRLYTDTDVDRLRMLRRATEAGRPISQVAALEPAQLVALVEEDDGARRRAEHGRMSALEGAASAAVASALEAVRMMDGERLEKDLLRSAIHVGRGVFLEQVAAPLMKQVGDDWHAGVLGVAQEHLATATLHRAVSWLLGATTGRERKLVVVATPPGQRHEMGALLSAAVAVDEGWRVLYLGSDVPGDEIGRAAAEGDASLVALSLLYPESDESASAALRQIRSAIEAGVEVVVGGAAAGSYTPVLREIEAHHVTDLGRFRDYLRERSEFGAAA